MCAVSHWLEPDGVLLFSNNFRRFELDAASLPELKIENITPRTIPEDFARNPRVRSLARALRILR